MVKQTIQIFARLKPTKGKRGQYEILEDEDRCPLLSFFQPKDLNDGVINNRKEQYRFRFERVFDLDTKQDQIFESVARPVIDNVLEGYNGTIFAYGQTGSGKTYTITGGGRHIDDRGIIMRSIEYIYDYYRKNCENEFTTHVSYLEIYNENGYDLLDPKQEEGTKLEDLPKVTLLEDSDQNIHLKNLSVHIAANDDEARNLLFQGDINRVVAETPMNMSSTRSHCIFTIHITSRVTGSAVVRRSKLHLVDLAGSERVSKTGVNGVLLTEAKYINLSLHHLEQVIVALSEKGRPHIPYRNCLMTSVLRDSLGGNCMTTMIATCSVEKANIDETISTCRFAQRVAMIKNNAVLNEELDPKLMVVKLKRDIEQLKEELALATGQQRVDALKEEELARCDEAVRIYLADEDVNSTISVGADMRKIHYCFHLLKKQVLSVKHSNEQLESNQMSNNNSSEQSSVLYHSKEMKELTELLQQRDNEINILVSMLKKEKKRADDAARQTPRLAGKERISSSNSTSDGSVADQKWTVNREQVEKTKQKLLADMSLGRQEAFDLFKRDYEHNDTIDSNKHQLKKLCTEAKMLGEQIGLMRNKIEKLKNSIEKQRMFRAMNGFTDMNGETDDVEHQLRQQFDHENSKYKETVHRLRDIKTQTDQLQHLLEKSKVTLIKDFEIWWAEQAAVVQDRQNKLNQLPHSRTKPAWQAPSMTPASTPMSASSVQSQNSDSQRNRAVPSYARNETNRQTHNSESVHPNRLRQLPTGDIMLTGDEETDADIAAFIRARENIRRQAVLSKERNSLR